MRRRSLFLLLSVHAVISASRCPRDRCRGRNRLGEAHSSNSTSSHDQQGRYRRRREGENERGGGRTPGVGKVGSRDSQLSSVGALAPRRSHSASRRAGMTSSRFQPQPQRQFLPGSMYKLCIHIFWHLAHCLVLFSHPRDALETVVIYYCNRNRYSRARYARMRERSPLSLVCVTASDMRS